MDGKRRYALTDGHEVAKFATMTIDEYNQAQKEAEEQSDGNWGWYPHDEPIDEYWILCRETAGE